MAKTDKDLLVDLNNKIYKEQAIWFLNAYWDKDLGLGNKNDELERIWKWTHVCIDLDKKGEEGNELDEFEAHRLLEMVDKVLTVKKMREVFTKIDLDFNKKVSLTEFLIYKYSVDYTYLVNAPQASGDALKKMKAAELMVTAAQEAMETCKVKEQEARERAKEQKAAESEVRKALAEIKEEEEKYDAEEKALIARANDQSLGIVKRGKAQSELAQWKAADNMEGIRRAKITQEAAVRKAERATRAAAAAKSEAERARSLSEKKFEEAQEALEEIKSRAGAGQGRVWWMMRELEESKKYMSNKQRARVEEQQARKEAELRKEMGLDV